MQTAILLVFLLGWAGQVWAGLPDRAVDVQIRSDSGRALPMYPVATQPASRKAYAEAVKSDQYSMVVRNLLDRRVGLVIAVDGRNIISGWKSWLRNDERMYILEPHGQGEFAGWRTTLDSVNRFYFTDAADSYAAAFGDQSAMGVIAVAVYPEVQRRESEGLLRTSDVAARPEAPSAKSEAESAGTGFGRQEHSPARLVAFDPERTPADKVLIKYEWRSTLCRQGIARCSPTPARNRLWDDGDFAPPPPGRS